MTGPTVGGRLAAIRVSVLVTTTMIVVGLAATGAAQEEDQAEPPQQQEQLLLRFEEEISVTGSLIPRPTLESLSPVTVMEPSDITQTGATRLEDLLQTLPQVFNAQNSTISNAPTGTATVDLRHLGEVRTLVLVNGRRMPAGDIWSVVPDLNFIPAGLVKRIDILTGGASSVYGADAVAGVVNFVLDTDLEGFKGGVEYGVFEHDNRNVVARRMNEAAGYDYPTGSVWDGDVTSAYAALGGAFGNGKGHATVYLDYRRTDAITKDHRDYTNCSVSNADVSLSLTGPVCGGSSTIPAGLFIAYNRDRTAGIPYVLDQSSNQLRLPSQSDLYNYGALNYMQRPDRRWLGGGFIRYEFNPHVEGYAEVMLMDDYTEAQIAPSGAFIPNSYTNVNCDNPMLSEQEHQLLCEQFGYADHEYANVIIGRRSVETGNRYDALRHTAWRLLGGARGEIDPQWTYDIYGLHAEVQIPESYHNDLNVSRMADALDVVGDPDDPSTWRCRSGNEGCVPWNIFTVGGVTQAAADYIRTVAMSESSTETEMLDGRLNGDLEGYGLKLPAASEGIQLAVGALHRKEGLVYDPDEVTRSGNAAGFPFGLQPVAGSYSVNEVYFEGRVPLVQDSRGARDLSLEIGYRYSDYNLAGAHPTYKAQLSWAPNQSVKLRAGAARATRAPNVAELFTPQVVGLGGGVDPCANDLQTGVPSASLEECVRTGVTPEQYGHILASPGGYNAIGGGNPHLVPEAGDTYTLGFVLTPTAAPGLTATADYYDIRMEDTVGTLPPYAAMTVCIRTGDPRVCDLIHRDVYGSLWLTPDGYIEATNQNIGTFRTRGVDVSFSYILPVGSAGFLNMNLIGTYLLESSFANPILGFDCAGYFGNSCGEPRSRWRHRATISWESSFHTVLSLGWRMVGAATNDVANPSPDLADPDYLDLFKASGAGEFPAYHYFDLSATYALTEEIQLTVGVNNVLDKEPPLAPGLADNDFGPGFYGTYDPWGRFVHASLLFTF